MQRSVVLLLSLAMAGGTVVSARPASDVRAQEGTPAVGATIEGNKALVRRFYEALNAGDMTALDDNLAPAIVDRNPSPADQPPGREGYKDAIAELLTGFPDFRGDIQQLIANGDRVAVRSVVRGTHAGPYAGIPETNRSIEVAAIDVWRVEGGELAEVWHVEDLLGLLGQIGVIPALDAAAAEAPTAVAAMATPAMPADPEANKALVRHFYEAVNARNLAAFDRFVAPDVVDRTPFAPGLPPGREGIRLSVAGILTPFPDWQITIKDVIAEGDLVVVRNTARGTHQGELLGVPATGRPVAIAAIEIWRVEGGQLVETWRTVELLSLLMQIGAIPGPATGPTTPAATPAA